MIIYYLIKIQKDKKNYFLGFENILHLSRRVMNSTIYRLTGQKDIVGYISSDLNSQSNYALLASEGMGKRTLCKILMDELENKKDFQVICIKANSSITMSDYEPFINTLSVYFKDSTLRNIVIESVRDIPFVGNTISAIVARVFTKKYNALTEKILNDQEQVIIKLMNDFIKAKNVLIICEDIDRWDEASLSLLIKLLDRNQKFLTLDKTSFFCTCNKKNLQIEQIISKCRKLTLKNIEKNDIICVMNIFANNTILNNDQVELVASVTGGNLQLIKECSSYINLLNSNSNIHVNSFYDLLSKRIFNDTSIPNQVIELLKYTSVIGVEAQKALLEEFTQGKIDQFIKALNEAFNLNFLIDERDKVSFIQIAIQKSFYSSIGEEISEYHLRLDKCLANLYPSSYYLRAHNILNGGKITKALTLYIIHLLNHYRNYGKPAVLIGNLGELLHNNADYFIFYNELLTVYKLYFANRYNEANNKLIMIETVISEFSFEIDYLYALINTNWKFTTSEFENGVYRLKHWTNDEFKKSNLEMWLRAAILLFEYENELNNLQAANNYLSAIKHILDSNILIDKSFKAIKYTLFYKANIYSKIEVAYLQTGKALEFFASTQTLHLQKYYFSLLNHAANEIVIGDVKHAYELMREAQGLLICFPDIEFPKTEIIDNNMAISGYLSCHISIDDSINILKRYNNLSSHADSLLINNNLVVLLALNGELVKALELVTEIYNKVNFIDDMDLYYKYFILNNYMFINYLCNNKSIVQKIIDEVITTIPLSNDKYYFLARNQYLKEIINQDNSNIPLISIWNDSLITKYPKIIGSAWRFWGKLLLFSELQIWSEC